jgi:glutamate formiminotransferase
VKGIGVALEDKGMVQVSMNIVDYEKNALYRVLEMIRFEARRWGVEVAETEIYGMIPARALLETAAYYLQVADFDPLQVLELKLLERMGAEEQE